MAGKIFTTYEVSKFCSVDISSVMGWVDEGKLQAYRTPGGHRRITQEDFLAFLEKYQMPIDPQLKKIGRRVLIVEDNPATARVLKRCLEKVDPSVEIAVAFDGFEAGRQIELFFPDLVLLDLMLPGIDGFQVCKNIRGDDLKKDVKILAISGLREPGIEKKILASGADRFIAKPFDINELQNTMALFLNGRENHRLKKLAPSV